MDQASGNSQICGLTKFVTFANLPHVWQFADLQISDPIFFAIFKFAIRWPKFVADLKLLQICKFFIFLLTNTYLKCSNVEAVLGRQFMQQKSAWDDLRGTSPATRHSYVHIAHTRYTHTCVITVSPHMWIQIYCTVLYCLPYCLVVSYMPPPH